MACLRTLHDELSAMLAELEALTSQSSFDEAALSNIRYRLSRVSGARRRLVESLCVDLIARGEPAEKLQALRDGNAAARIASTAHIGAWTLAEVANDWAGYCRASATMRARMRRQVEREKAVLYPHLALEPTDARAVLVRTAGN